MEFRKLAEEKNKLPFLLGKMWRLRNKLKYTLDLSVKKWHGIQKCEFNICSANFWKSMHESNFVWLGYWRAFSGHFVIFLWYEFASY